MENLGMVSSPKIVLGLSPNPRNALISVSSKQSAGLPNLLRKTGKSCRKSNPSHSVSVVSLFEPRKPTKTIVAEKVQRDCFASIASSGQQTSSVGVNPQISAPPTSQVCSPLFWIGVGVGFSALFSWVAGRVKKYAMEQALKTFTQQMNTQNNPFGNTAFAPGSPFPFSPPSPPQSTSPTSDSFKSGAPSFKSGAPAASQSITDIPATKVEDPPSTSVNNKVEPQDAPKKYAFVDVSPEETVQKSAFEDYKESAQTDSSNNYSQQSEQVPQNGTPSNQGTRASDGPSTSTPLLSVDALEKMMEDPTVQKMVFPYLPEEMRNPTTFKWMLQNPVYRQQLQDMLNNMGGNPEWDNRMMDTLKNFDLSSPEIKQQFDQIGLTPDEVISKIMANPDVAMAFQNPRVQAAILDCSQNPLSIAKYQNDKEVMDVFNKISELFPGTSP
ncbi:protein TIC 40, chloroplastic-like [Salvia splendens]|uniref:protein TIC 40, chloroplastic-like n=1 Tax=Salvia splendens TaxID=180675 RepID=UPI001C277023|nr:protein TIC 40, chloroplastic-like [Salvia splendens]